MRADPRASWRWKAKCHEEVQAQPFLDAAWNVKNDDNAKHAKSVCETVCPVRIDCLVDALQDKKAEGLRAGFFFDSGVVSRKDAKKILAEFGLTAPTSQRALRE